MTDSDLVSKLYEDDDLTGKYANPVCVVENIKNPTFLGWEVQLSEVPIAGDHISLSPVSGSLIKQWIEKAANKDEALSYFLNLVKKKSQLYIYSRDSYDECLEDAEVIERIIWGTDYIEGLADGSMIVDKRFFIPGCDTVVLAVNHIL